MTKQNGLLRLRKALGFTQQELAVKACVSVTVITMIEKYSYYPGAKVRAKMAQALGVPEEQIFPSDGSQ